MPALPDSAKMRFQSMEPLPNGQVAFDRVTNSKGVVLWAGAFFRPILDVNQREAAGVLIEIRDGILTAHRHPAKIHFHFYEFGISFGEKKIVRQFSAEAAGFRKLEGMIVIRELDAGLFRGPPPVYRTPIRNPNAIGRQIGRASCRERV